MRSLENSAVTVIQNIERLAENIYEDGKIAYGEGTFGKKPSDVISFIS